MKANNHIEVLQTMRIMYLLMMVCCAQALEIERLKRRNGTVDLKQCYPVEPVGVIVLGIDGLRQDVLYPAELDKVQDGGQYRVDIQSLPGLRQILRQTAQDSAMNSYIMLPEVTTIFPSITFAAWASILSGKQPNETGIVGNEFFSRDVNWVPGQYMLPSGVITLDADGGAFRPIEFGRGYSRIDALKSLPFILNYIMPADFDIFRHPTLESKLLDSAPGHALKYGVNPFWADINLMVKDRYWNNAVQSASNRCDSTPYECRTVSFFNQYAKGVDWWGTPSSWSGMLYSAATSTNSAEIMDKAAVVEATRFLESYFSNKNYDGKRKRFPAVFSVYLAGLDHTAHLNGLSGYTNYFRSIVDVQINKLAIALQNQGEFDNKIFIILADHGHTAMPTNLTYSTMEVLGYDDEGNEITGSVTKPVEMSCELKMDFGDNNTPNMKARLAELNNNSLHIWELGEMFKAVGKFTKGAFSYRVLAPEAIAKLFSKKEAFGARSVMTEANVIAALNGPMAHIYVTEQSDLGKIAEVFRLTMQVESPAEAAQWFNLSEDGYLDLKNTIDKLQASVDKILVRSGGSYCVFDGLNANGSPRCASGDTFDAQSYVEAWPRITGMNHPQRSGDIVLIMKDATAGSVLDRYSTAYACKSWHGSLNPSDSYVPFILAYPGGNKLEIDKIIQNENVCKSDYSNCQVNWKLPDIIKALINQQYQQK